MNLIFIYSTTELILLTLLAWAVVAAANVPILIYIGNRLGKFHKTREKERALAKMMVFAKRAAHDLRSPLSALKAVRILIEKEPERAAKLLEQSMSRVDLIAEDLLVQSRVDLDGIRVLGKEAAKESAQREESFKLSLAMKEIVDEKKLSVSESSHVRISFFDEAEEALLAVERATFQRVLSNIIQNSLEAVDKNGFISISTGVETNFVCIEVRDNGKGIPEEVVRRLNENPHSFNKPNGNGLGLSSAKEFAEFYGGSLLIDSKVNGGTLVVLRLPIRHRPK